MGCEAGGAHPPSTHHLLDHGRVWAHAGDTSPNQRTMKDSMVILTPKEVGHRLKLSDDAVVKRCRLGLFTGAYLDKLPGKDRGQWRIPEFAVQKYQEQMVSRTNSETEKAVKAD